MWFKLDAHDYIPSQYSGKIEHLHSTLKYLGVITSLNRDITNSSYGLLAALHEDSKYTNSEMVYSKYTKLPVEFFEGSKSPISTHDILNNIRRQMALLKPYTYKFKCKQTIFMPIDLYRVFCVFRSQKTIRYPI